MHLYKCVYICYIIIQWVLGMPQLFPSSFFFFQVTKKSALKSKIIRLMLPMSNPNECPSDPFTLSPETKATVPLLEMQF